MIRDNRSLFGVWMIHDDVATRLVIDNKAKLFELGDGYFWFSWSKLWHQTATEGLKSTRDMNDWSSEGIGSLCFLRLVI